MTHPPLLQGRTSDHRAWFGLGLLLGLVLALWAPTAAARKQTVCTITVNSSDEKEVFRRHLPASKVEFVELVERGRADWLASACRAGVSCDVLIISGHYDGYEQFFSDRLEASEFLPVSELERVSCSDSCTGLLANLKEVHLYGCNTLNPEAQSSATAEIVRSLVREGHSIKEAEQRMRELNAGHGESSRDRMRQVFKDVPVIYGFSSTAPLGPIAGSILGGYFRAAGAHEIGQGRPSTRLLARFAGHGMSWARGMSDQDPQAPVRQDVCRFVDDRMSESQRLAFVHRLLQREMAQSRVHLDRIQRLTSTLSEPAWQTPEAVNALALITRDTTTRARFLDFARDADRPAVRARMLKVAHDLGWLSDEERWRELALMLGRLEARAVVGVTEVNLACTLNQGRELDGAFNPRVVAGSSEDDVPHAAVRACLGSAEGVERTLQGLLGQNAVDGAIAQDYLRHRPITDPDALRRLAAGIVDMPPSAAQVRALEMLARHYLDDGEILNRLVELFGRTPSAQVQTAIAGILIRADRRPMTNEWLLRTLRLARKPAARDSGMIDALLQRLQAS